MVRKFDERLIRHRIEKVVSWLALITSMVGVAERATHYYKLAEKNRKKKSHPIGFR